MAATYDLVIRNGMLADGTGAAMREADVAVLNGKIVAVGRNLSGSGKEEIDAHGKLVTPGFVDIHTHYDGQVTWANRITPSSNHGVTTVVMSNCGIGFAPCKPEHRHDLVKLMEGVEDIPEPVMTAGLPWTWETFPDYLNFVGSRSFDIDVAAQLPHAALRVYVMGKRALTREDATEADCAEMSRLAKEAMEAGAMGFSTSRSINHKSLAGDNIPSYGAAEQELHTIAAGLTEAKKGVLQMIVDFEDEQTTTDRMALVRRLAEKSGRPLSFSLAQFYNAPDAWAQALGLLEKATADGLPMRGQVLPRPIGAIIGLEGSRNPFSVSASYQKIADLPLAQRVQKMREPETRGRIIAEAQAVDGMFQKFDLYFPLGDNPNYEPDREDSVAARAKKAGVTPEEITYDLLLEHDGHGLLLGTFANFYEGTLEHTLTMMKSESTVIGLGDGGAHCGLICDASYSTHMLSYWGRDRKRGEKLSIPFIIKSLTQDTAKTVGLLDRGVIAPGYKADINVIDMDRLKLCAPRFVYDLPAGGRRLEQLAEGYVAGIVSGMVIHRDGVHTGTLPGRLVRGQQAKPN